MPVPFLSRLLKVTSGLTPFDICVRIETDSDETLTGCLSYSKDLLAPPLPSPIAFLLLLDYWKSNIQV